MPVDNLSTPALLDHYLRGSLAAPEQPLAVNVEHKISVQLGRFEKWDDFTDARIVHQDIQTSKLIDRYIYHCLDLLLVTHVYCYGYRFAVAACYLVDNLISVMINGNLSSSSETVCLLKGQAAFAPTALS